MSQSECATPCPDSTGEREKGPHRPASAKERSGVLFRPISNAPEIWIVSLFCRFGASSTPAKRVSYLGVWTEN